MNNFKWFFVFVGILGLIGVRSVQNDLFYDPFLDFFKSADKKAIFPAFEWLPLILNHFFRFLLNAFFSVMIIHFLFLNKKYTFQALILMLIVFAITLPIYLFCVYTKFEIGYLFSFYMRRFVIQPLILLLIIPLFYYRKGQLENAAN